MYHLMNKDEKIASFNITPDNGISDLITLSENMPYGFTKNPALFLESRGATSHNRHLKRIMNSLGCDSLLGFVKITHALSLNDTIWVTSDEESLKWRNVSLYRNPFNDVLEQLAFEGYGLPENLSGSGSPSLTVFV